MEKESTGYGEGSCDFFAWHLRRFARIRTQDIGHRTWYRTREIDIGKQNCIKYQVSRKQTVRFGKISKDDSEALAPSEGLTNGIP